MKENRPIKKQGPITPACGEGPGDRGPGEGRSALPTATPEKKEREYAETG